MPDPVPDSAILLIKARPANGFWRCGVHHPAQWVQHPAGRWGPLQIQALRDEPMLEVELLADPPVPADPEQETDPAAAPDAGKTRKGRGRA